MIKQFIAYLTVELAYSPHTIRAYTTDLESWVNFTTGNNPEALRPTSVTTNDIRAWIAAMGREHLTATTIKRRLSAVRAFYRYLTHRGLAADNPAARATVTRRSKPLPRFIDSNELNGVLAAAAAQAHIPDADYLDVRNNLILNMLYQTGMRASELTSLTVGQIDLTRRELKVLGKRNKERLIPFGHALEQDIRAYAAVRTGSTAPDAPWFTDLDGNPMNYTALYRTVRKHLDGNVSSATRSPHTLRHTFATDMLNNGANLVSVQQLLGHASLATTQIYTHISAKEIMTAYNTAHPRAKK